MRRKCSTQFANELAQQVTTRFTSLDCQGALLEKTAAEPTLGARYRPLEFPCRDLLLVVGMALGLVSVCERAPTDMWIELARHWRVMPTIRKAQFQW